ncbi:hypothetical protein [Acinetobacter sp. NCu2D-2]|uniref:hypothetical protein n=1 Tax=Acinetobacter sp. NCu2D-2 TaxID=1608473 RepID=UPI001D0D0534|nr:hypothetical protein [Acinetobacter sp. NCu2D-2]
MTQNNFEQRLLEERKWTIVGVSLLAVFIVGLLIYGYGSMHGSSKVKGWLGGYACGKFGDQHMLIDKNDLYFARVSYQDVNYWGEYKSRACYQGVC